MRRLLRAFLIALILTATVHAEETPTQNYILIIDNSLSTTGSHSLGSATDPDGLRFDAARLVYENVVAKGIQGKLSVIVFCGPDNCICYGPEDLNADPAVLNETIGQYLNEQANQGHRDKYTDIRTALDKARSLMPESSDEAEKAVDNYSVILLTDGVNDLTNRADPFSQLENIEANDESVEIITDIKNRGADFYVIALTAKDNVQNTDAFMEFINRMAEAGGGETSEGGTLDNVLMATQNDLGSKLLQMLVKAETSIEANVIENTVQDKPESFTFNVPYKGISDASVNITFMPEDRPNLDTVTISAPDGTTYTVYENGVAANSDTFTIIDDRSYIILEIPEPLPGEWNVTTTSRPGTNLSLTTVVRYNHNLKLHVDLPYELNVSEPQKVNVWFEQYVDDHFVALQDSDIYELSTSVFTVYAPDGQSQSLPMVSEGNSFTTDFIADIPGTWNAEVTVQNGYLVEHEGNIVFNVLGETATELNDNITVDIPSEQVSDEDTGTISEPGSEKMAGSASEGIFHVEAAGEEQVNVSWDGGEGEAILTAAGSDVPIISGIHSGDTIDLSVLEEGQEYALMVQAYTDTSGSAATLPDMKSLDLKVDVDQIGDVILSVGQAVVQLAPAMEITEEVIDQAIETGKALQDSLKEGPNTGGESAESSTENAAASGGSISEETSGESGDAEENTVEEDAVDESTVEENTEAEEDDEKTKDEEIDQKDSDKNSEKEIEPVIQDDTAPDSGGPLSAVKDNWMYMAGGIGAAAILLLILLIIKEKGGEKMSGNMKITCEPINLDMLIHFEGRGRIKSGSPLTKHPDVAKLKGGKIYDVLSNLQVSMSRANHQGLVDGSESPHMPNEDLITVTYIDPRNGKKEICYIGRNDVVDPVLNIYDVGRMYEVYFSGKLNLDEILYREKR